MHTLFVGGKYNGTTSYVRGSLVLVDADNSYQVHESIAVSIIGHTYRVAVYKNLLNMEEWELNEAIRTAADLATKSISEYSVFSCIGEATDTVLGADKRTVAGVAGRLLEEVVELCLAAGLSTEQIYGHATDSIYNQYVKLSKNSGAIQYPSAYKFQFSKEDLAGEIGDVRVMLEDVAHRAGLNADLCFEDRKLAFFQKVKEGRFYANNKGLLYVRKPHMDFSK